MLTRYPAMANLFLVSLWELIAYRIALFPPILLVTFMLMNSSNFSMLSKRLPRLLNANENVIIKEPKKDLLIFEIVNETPLIAIEPLYIIRFL